jgi:hypothetical protein
MSASRRLRGRPGFRKALPGHKSQRLNAASIPLVCEVCREGPVTIPVADFIVAYDSCAKRIATALWHGRQDRVVAGEICPLIAK